MILIAFIIIIWPFYTKLLIQDQPDNYQISKIDSSDKKRDTLRVSANSKEKMVSESVKSNTQEGVRDTLRRKNVFWTDDNEKIIAIQSKLFSVRISNRAGGLLKQWALKKYRNNLGEYVNVINSSKNREVSFAYHGQTINLGDAVFSCSSADSLIDLEKQKSWTVTYSLVFDKNKAIVQTYTFYNDAYHFDFDVEFKNFGDDLSNSEYQLQWSSGLIPTEKDKVSDLSYFKAYSMLGDEKEEFDVHDKSGDEASFTGSTKWVASRTKYFVLYMIPNTKDGVACKFIGQTVVENGVIQQKNNLISMSMKFDANKKDSFKIYIGPIEFSVLNQYNENLTVIMEWGWAIMRPLTKAILYTFNFLYGMIPNYGWVIIIFAFIVKIILHPLTHKTYVGMQKMKEVMPRQKEIQKKFKDNPSKMQQEMMKLYKEIGYNPLSGCLPMLIQMPILFPIYQVFRESIDLRQAHFFGWIQDLSLPDTVATLHTGLPFIGDFNVNPLPVIMKIGRAHV
jgi:YidC/Oxa1 family membrane protein insertase